MKNELRRATVDYESASVAVEKVFTSRSTKPMSSKPITDTGKEGYIVRGLSCHSGKSFCSTELPAPLDANVRGELATYLVTQSKLRGGVG